jgi:ribonuclease PH
MRTDSRGAHELRPVSIEPGFLSYPEGSCLVTFGNTRVLCSAMVEDRVPHFMKGTGQGWITAEYGMIPGATQQRSSREASTGRPKGRTQEIQRLIGRSLRTVVNLADFPDRTLWVDCDVLQADGGTRTAAITGAFCAMAMAFDQLSSAKIIKAYPVKKQVAAISVGIVGGEKILDLKYDEDSIADVDMNVIMCADGRFIEVQGTAEKEPFSKSDLDAMLALAAQGIDQLFLAQRKALPFDLDKYGI